MKETRFGGFFLQLMLRSTHEEHDPQMTLMAPDTEKRDEQTYAVIGAAMAGHGNWGTPRLEYEPLVFNLRHLRIVEGA